jgi:hypothetical protein
VKEKTLPLKMVFSLQSAKDSLKESKGLGPEKDCAGEGQQHIQKTDPSSSQRGRPTKTRP